MYQQENSLNPNRKRYRLLWQAAYAAVVFTIRQNKSARTEWQKCVFHLCFSASPLIVVSSRRLLDIAKSAKEREALLEMHHKKGKYSNNKGRCLCLCLLSVLSSADVDFFLYLLNCLQCATAYKGNGISPDEIRVFRENLKSRREIDGGGRLARRRTAAMASL